MSKFESPVKQLPYPQQKVYDCISNLESLKNIRDKVPQDKVKDFSFDADNVCMSIENVGELKMRIVNREEPKCVKFESVESPLPFTLWIQVLPVTETTSKMKVTIDAELNPFVRTLVSGPLQKTLDKLADTMSELPYS